MNELRIDCPMRHENGNCTAAGGFCTAVNDPICEALHNAYNCGYRCAALQMSDVIMKRKIQRHADTNDIWTYYNPEMGNPCGCGSNCYHYEYDGKRVIGVCNACNQDIYEVKPEYVKEYLDNGVWE